MRIHHSRLRGEILVHRAHKQQLPRRLLIHTLPLRSILGPHRHNSMQDPAEHRSRRVKNTHIFPEDIGGSQRIQRNRTREASFILHQRAQEVHRAVVQGAMVGMVADAVVVEGEEDIDGGNRSRGRSRLVPALTGLARGVVGGRLVAGQVGRERRGEDGGDVTGGPVGLHAIREALGVVDDEHVRVVAQAELSSGFMEFFGARAAQAIGITCRFNVSLSTLFS